VFLDEPFSSTDKETEETLLGLLLDRGITCVVIKHEQVTSGRVIRLLGDGEWDDVLV
jgi:ABC-type bacteriocin/lantibiotic exporter with double-glycine peptidase domain